MANLPGRRAYLVSGPVRRYATPEAFRRALDDRLKTAAAARGRDVNLMRRQFLLQRYLARVFHDPASPWVLKGGTGLLVRLPGARHSQDIDLLHLDDAELAAAVAELRRVADIRGLDPFTFTVGEPTQMLGGVAGATVRITVSLGVAVLDRFPLDLSTGRVLVAGLERHQLQPMVEIEDVAALPEVTLYPLPDQIADKVAAMVERHGIGGRASTRYRDLVDLVLIVGSCEIDAQLTRAALSAQAQRRELTLPLTLSAPSPAWMSGYRDAVGDATLPAGLRTLQAALTAAGGCVNALLDGTVTHGTWDPSAQQWRP